MSKNILILSAGRRVELVKAFQEAAKALSPTTKIYASDLYPQLSSACQVADGAFYLPRIGDTLYLDTLKKIKNDQNIALIIPTIDTELKIISENSKNFSDCTPIISSLDIIAQCRDKRLTAELFSKLHISTPAIFSQENLQFPCFCKPYDGSSSIGAFPILDRKELTQEILNNNKNIFMELISNEYCEYTIDAYYDRSHKLICLIPRKRLEIRAGEVSKGVTRKNFVYDFLLERVKIFPGAIGCITFQVFVNEKTQDIKGLEINPRFGGGFPLSYSAGGNYPGWLISEYILGKSIPFFSEWEENLLMLRYDAKELVHNYD